MDLHRGVVLSFALAALSVACGLEPTTGTRATPITEIIGDPAGPGASVTDQVSVKSYDLAQCDEAPSAERRVEVCRRWHCDGRGASEAAQWAGDPAACNAGDLDPRAAERALRLVNVHRWLAGLDPVASEASWTAAAQGCALVAHANKRLSHTPGRDWQCWSDEAALASQVSLIANRSASNAVLPFFEDPGNEETMVHRRWLLAEELSTVGFGSTDRYTCIVVAGSELDRAKGKSTASPEAPAGARGWSAWPPAGPVPIDVFTSERLDTMGWTVQSSSVGLEAAEVTVTEDGTPRPVRVSKLTPNQGSRSALRFVPDGWTTQAGRTYAVSVRGKIEIDFSVEPVDCAP